MWKAFWIGRNSSLAMWSELAFETMTFRSKAGSVQSLLINDPEGIRHVMVSNAVNYRRPVSVPRIVRPLVGDGLLLAEGEEWRRQRRFLAPTFAPKSISLLIPQFQAAGLHLLRTVEKTERVNLSQAFQDTAMEAVLRALFSMPENSARGNLIGLMRAYLEGPGRPIFLDIFAKSEESFAFVTRKRKKFQGILFAEIEAIISGRKTGSDEGGKHDLLDLLLSIRDVETGEPLSTREIRDQCSTMFFAGSETTARMMFWATYLLTQDIEEQNRVRREIAAFPPERVRDLEDLQNWPRLRNVLLESLRLYPPVAHLIRESIGPDTVAGESIPANTQIWISPWVMHRHRKFWEHPTAFVPDRFAGMTAPWTQIPAYIPFGVGPRICIGLAFALAEAQIVLATLLARYLIALPCAKPVLPVARVAIEPSYEPIFSATRTTG